MSKNDSRRFAIWDNETCQVLLKFRGRFGEWDYADGADSLATFGEHNLLIFHTREQAQRVLCELEKAFDADGSEVELRIFELRKMGDDSWQSEVTLLIDPYETIHE